MSTLPTNAAQRKALPIYSGFIRYFPDAIAAVAELSRIGNDQHNPGKPLHWDRSKSGDECDALSRHLLEAGTIDTDGVRHSAKLAWRAMANLQKEIEAEALAKAGLDDSHEALTFGPLDEGWIPWSGGKCPVGLWVQVEVRFPEGTINQDNAGRWIWGHDPDNPDSPENIVAYRVVKA